MSQPPVLLCYDASEDATSAIRAAAELLGARPALVLTVWENLKAIPPFAWVAPMADLGPLLEVAQEGAERVAAQGAELAAAAGFAATPVAVQANGPTWERIAAVADEHDAAVIVVGSRGLSGVRSALAGSVSTGVVHHAGRPVLVVHGRD